MGEDAVPGQRRRVFGGGQGRRVEGGEVRVGAHQPGRVRRVKPPGHRAEVGGQGWQASPVPHAQVSPE